MTIPALLLTLEDAAQAMGNISARTLRRLIDAGEIPAVKIKGSAPRYETGILSKKPNKIINL